MSASADLCPARLAPGLPAEEMLVALAVFGAVADAQARDGMVAVRLPAERLREALVFVRDEARWRCHLLLDIVGVDHLVHPGWRGRRFAVSYLLRSAVFRHRVRLTVEVDEGQALPTASGLWPIADWLEREVYDQYGIVFDGHGDLRRLLNHHEFTGHPLRKDYPAQRRQRLSVNESLFEPLMRRLSERGYEALEEEPGDREPGDLREGGGA